MRKRFNSSDRATIKLYIDTMFRILSKGLPYFLWGSLLYSIENPLLTKEKTYYTIYQNDIYQNDI